MKAVIPGASITEDMNSRPYTKAPEMSNPEDVLQFYLERLSNKEGVKAAMTAVEAGMPIMDITRGFIRLGTAGGKHSIDAGMVVAPIIHEKIRGLADAYGIEFDDGFEDPAKAKKKKEQEDKYLVHKAIKSPPRKEVVQPPVEEVAEKPSRGLIKRRSK